MDFQNEYGFAANCLFLLKWDPLLNYLVFINSYSCAHPLYRIHSFLPKNKSANQELAFYAEKRNFYIFGMWQEILIDGILVEYKILYVVEGARLPQIIRE